MTAEQKEIYIKTVRRLSRGGATDPTAQIIALAEEIDYYRNKIYWLENQPKEAAETPARPPQPGRYTKYDPGLERFVVPLTYAEGDTRVLFRLGMTGHKYPDCVFGEVIDKLARYENQEEKQAQAQDQAAMARMEVMPK